MIASLLPTKFIQHMRKKHNLTQEFLASKIGVSRPTYIQIEQGEKDLTISSAKTLADIFGISFDDFIAGKEPRHEVVLVVGFWGRALICDFRIPNFFLSLRINESKSVSMTNSNVQGYCWISIYSIQSYVF